MFGCFRSLGCLLLALVLIAVAFLSRDAWLPRVTGERSAAATEVTWEPITPEREARARRSVASLSRRSGPVFVNLTAAELSALVMAEADRRFPALVEQGVAAIEGERLLVRATADLSQLRGLDALGPLGAVLGSRQRIALSGTVDVLAPGVAQFVVGEVKLGDLRVPRNMIPRLVSQLDRGERPPSAAPDALVFAVPAYVGDVRVAKGRVTLYKNVQ